MWLNKNANVTAKKAERILSPEVKQNLVALTAGCCTIGSSNGDSLETGSLTTAAAPANGEVKKEEGLFKSVGEVLPSMACSLMDSGLVQSVNFFHGNILQERQRGILTILSEMGLAPGDIVVDENGKEVTAHQYVAKSDAFKPVNDIAISGIAQLGDNYRGHKLNMDLFKAFNGGDSEMNKFVYHAATALNPTAALFLEHPSKDLLSDQAKLFSLMASSSLMSDTNQKDMFMCLPLISKAGNIGGQNALEDMATSQYKLSEAIDDGYKAFHPSTENPFKLDLTGGLAAKISAHMDIDEVIRGLFPA